MMKVFRDYCGIINEETIRKNFVLVYEIIDEIIDYGHPQLMATENIRQYTVSDAVVTKQEQTKPQNKILSFFKPGTTSANAVNRPMSNMNKQLGGKKDKPKQKSDKNEIFVDIFEKLSVLFN